MTTNSATALQQTDFDLHGKVGIRLVNASRSDLAAVTRQLGQLQPTLPRRPDIVIEFVDEIPLSSPLQFIGVEDAAFTNDAFFVLKSKHKSRAIVQIPFADIGQECRILCETGLNAVPLLIPILNLTAVARGLLPLHASAFEYEGMGVLTTGWSKGGKTETLLAFMAQGAKYVGDEWIYLSEDGKEMCGISEPIRIWEWHLQSMPHYWNSLGQSEKTRLKMLKVAAQWSDGTANNRFVQKFGVGKVIRRSTPLLKQQLHADIAPGQLFGQDRQSPMAPVDKVVFVASHASPEVKVTRADAVEVVRRMVFSLQEERKNFISTYHKFRFAFPDLCNPLIENVQEAEYKLLTRILADKEAYALTHPYPVDLPALYTALAPMLHQERR